MRKELITSTKVETKILKSLKVFAYNFRTLKREV